MRWFLAPWCSLVEGIYTQHTPGPGCYGHPVFRTLLRRPERDIHRHFATWWRRESWKGTNGSGQNLHNIQELYFANLRVYIYMPYYGVLVFTLIHSSRRILHCSIISAILIEILKYAILGLFLLQDYYFWPFQLRPEVVLCGWQDVKFQERTHKSFHLPNYHCTCSNCMFAWQRGLPPKCAHVFVASDQKIRSFNVFCVPIFCQNVHSQLCFRFFVAEIINH